MDFGEKDHRGKVSVLRNDIKGACYQHDFSPVDVELDHLADIVLSGFSAVNYYSFFSPFLYYTL